MNKRKYEVIPGILGPVLICLDCGQQMGFLTDEVSAEDIHRTADAHDVEHEDPAYARTSADGRQYLPR